MTAPATDAQGEGIAGVDFNPFEGQENSDFLWNPLVLLCHIIALLYKPALGWVGYFPPHNYLQWHVLEAAITDGFNAPPRDDQGVLAKLKFPKIPDCPKLWQPVFHYWNFGGFMGILVYETLAFIRIEFLRIVIVVALLIAIRLGQMTPQQAMAVILQQLGIVV